MPGELKRGIRPRATAKNGSRLVFHGVFGSGKSYILAALACYLQRDGEFVVYIPDCADTLISGAFSVVKEAMLLTFSKEDRLFDEIFEAGTIADLGEILGRLRSGRKIFFILDHFEQFDCGTEDEEGERILRFDIDTAREMLGLAELHRVIIGASSMSKNLQEPGFKEGETDYYAVDEGFTEVCNP